LQDLLKRDTPIEFLIEYIGAPDIDATVETKSVIYNRLAKNYRPNYSTTFKEKVVPVMTFGAFFGAILLGGTALLTLSPDISIAQAATEASASSDKLAGMIAPLVPLGEFIYTNAPEIGMALLLGLTLAKSYKEWSESKNSVVELHSQIAKKSNNLAESFFGYEKHKDKIKNQLDGISEADKHLLKHLSPYEMRTVLVSGPEKIKDLLDCAPHSFSQRKSALATTQGWLMYTANMMITVIPEKIKSKIVRLGYSFNEFPVSQKTGLIFEDEYDSSASLSKRLQKFRAEKNENPELGIPKNSKQPSL